jgi:3-hydroxybutyryl-CoA dehydrogenase
MAHCQCNEVYVRKPNTMPANDIRHILIVGAGTMGRQIAWQCASHGFDVTLTDANPDALTKATTAIKRFAAGAAGAGALSEIEARAALGRLRATADPDYATVDLVSESVYEDPVVKGQVFAHLNTVCPPATLFTTNTSTLLPSMFAAATGRPDRFCALHFHLPVWTANVADVMGHAGTSAETLATVAAFARRIGQVPIVLQTEHSGYVFNDMFNALNTAAIGLVAGGVATIEDVDRAWMGIMKMPVGPGGWLDDIGLDTVWRITDYWAGVTGDPRLRQNAALLKGYVDQGRLGRKSGRGFYEYPNPAYTMEGFLE